MDYAELTSRLAELLDRTDLTNEIPFFIEQAEEVFVAPPDNGGIRHWRMAERAVVSVDEQYLSYPPGFIEVIRLHNQTNGNRMELLSREAMQEGRSATDDEAGIPTHYRHASNGTFALWPTPLDTTIIELEYYARPPQLNKDIYGVGAPVTSNWISENYPSVYLYGAALHSAPHLHDDLRIQTWAALYSAAATRLNAEGARAQVSASSPRLRNRGLPTSRTPGSQNRYRG